jgi:hypothetical protein
MMRKVTQTYIIFILMFLAALFQATSGLVMWLVLPSGQGYQGGRACGWFCPADRVTREAGIL